MQQERCPATIFGTEGSNSLRLQRRAVFGLILFLLPWPATASQPKLGDDEWFRRFRVFVKVFNRFVDSLNDGKVDLVMWRQMREAWKNMDCE